MSTISTQSSEGSKNEIVADNNKDWCVSISKKINKLYYFNSKTGESVWEKPEGVIFSIKDVEQLLAHLLSKKMSRAKQTERTDKTPSTYFDYPSNVQHENSPPESNLKDDFGQISGTSLDNKSILNKPNKLVKRKRKKKKVKQEESTLAHLWKSSLSIQRKIENLRKSELENPTIKLNQTDSVNEEENNETFMDWEDGPQENVEEVKNGMLFEDNLNGRNNSEQKNDATSYQFEMNPKQEFNPKLAIVLDTNILVSNLKYVQSIKDKPFNEFPARFIVPYIVLEELDHLKKKKGTIRSRGARNAIRMIHFDVLSKHPRIIGQNAVDRRAQYEVKTSTTSDDLIIECCSEQRKAGYNVLLFTDDRNMGTRALLNGIESVGVTEMKELFPDIPKSSQFVNSKPHTNVSPQSSFGRLHVEEVVENKPVNGSDVIPESSRRQSNYVTETSQNRTGSQFVNSKPHTNVSPQSSFGRLHVEEVVEKNRTVQSTKSIIIPEQSKINKVKISKKVPENAKLLVTELKQALQSFLTAVLKIDEDYEKSSILNVCLCSLQTKWTKVTNLQLLEEDILTILTLKRLLRPVEDISWTVTSVDELMNAVINFAGRFQKSNMYNLLTTAFTLSLRDCQIIERRLKQEIIHKETIIPEVVNETEAFIATAALHTAWGHVYSICESLPSNSKKTDPQSLSSRNKPISQNSKDKSKGSNALEKLNDNEEPFELNTTKPESKNLPLPDEDFIDQLSVLYKNVSDMLKGFEGVLNENLRTLKLTHPSIQLLYNTILALLPDSMPLDSPEPKYKNVYLLVDLTPKCILEYCSQENNRASLVNAKDRFSDFLFEITKYYDDYFSRNYKKK